MKKKSKKKSVFVTILAALLALIGWGSIDNLLRAGFKSTRHVKTVKAFDKMNKAADNAEISSRVEKPYPLHEGAEVSLDGINILNDINSSRDLITSDKRDEQKNADQR